MAQHFLNRAEVTAAVEKVCREGVSERMRVYGATETGTGRPDAQPSTDV
jgi:hypothetical protein